MKTAGNMNDNEDIATLDTPEADDNGGGDKPKPKFNPSVKFEPVEQSVKPKFDPNAHYEPAFKSTLNPRERVNQSQASESTAIPRSIVPTGTPMTHDEYVAKAKNNIAKTLSENDHLIPGIIAKEKYEADKQKMFAEANADPLTAAAKGAEQLGAGQPEYQMPQASEQEVAQYKQAVQTNPIAERAHIAKVIQLTGSTQLQHDAGVADADMREKQGQKVDWPQVRQNLSDIKEGKGTYNPQTGQYTKFENPIESVFSGYDDKQKAFGGFDKYNSITDPSQGAKMLDEELANVNPDEPLKVPSNFIGELGRGLASQPFRGMIMGKTVGGIVAAIPGAEEFAPAADKFVSAAVSGSDFKKMAYYNSLKSIYSQLVQTDQYKNNHDVAYQLADKQARQESNIEGIAGASMMQLAGKIGEMKIPAAIESPTFKNAALGIIKHVGKVSAEAGAVGGISATAQHLEDELALNKGIDRDQSAKPFFDKFGSGFAFTFAVAGLGQLSELGKNIRNPDMRSPNTVDVLQAVSKVDDKQLDAELGNQLMQGSLTPKQAVEVKQAVSEYKAVDQKVPGNIAPEVRGKIVNLIQKRGELETEMKGYDKPLQEGTQIKIDKINEQITELAKTKPVEQADVPRATIAEESKNEQDTGTSILQQAVANKDIKGAQSDVAEMVLSKNDIEKITQFYKEVADQALNKVAPDASPSDSESYKQAVNDYGQAVVDHATKLFPLKTEDNAETIRSNQGRSGGQGALPESSKNKGGEDIQLAKTEASNVGEAVQPEGGEVKVTAPEDFEKEVSKILPSEQPKEISSPKTKTNGKRNKTEAQAEETVPSSLGIKDQGAEELPAPSPAALKERQKYAYDHTWAEYNKKYPGTLTRKQYIEDASAHIQERKRLAANDKIIENGGVQVGDRANTADQYMDKAKAVLNQLFPDHKLEAFDKEEDYTKATDRPKGSAGVFDPSTKTISLNLERIKKQGAENTIFHEVIHPIVKEALQSKPEGINDAYSQLIALKDEKGMADVWQHEEHYRGRGLDTMKVEAVTEFLTKVADGSIDPDILPKSLSAKIVDVINRIMKALGIDKQFSSPADFKKLAEGIKESFDKADATPLKDIISKPSDAGDIYDKLAPDEEDEMRKLIARTNLPEDQIRDILEKKGLTSSEIDDLLTDTRKQDEQLRTMTRDQVKQVLQDQKNANPLSKQIAESKIVDKTKEATKSLINAIDPFLLDKGGLGRDAAIIIRSNKGIETSINSQADQAFEANRKFWRSQSKIDKLSFILGMENPEKFGSVALRDMGKLYRDRLDKVFDMISKIKDIDLIEDYFPHFWKNPKKAAVALGKRPMEGNKSFLKQRFYNDIMEGMQKGLKLATDNPEEMVRLAEQNALKFKTARDIFNDLSDNNLIKHVASPNDIPPNWEKLTDPMFTKQFEYKTGGKKERGDFYAPQQAAAVINNYTSKGLFNTGGILGNTSDFIRNVNNLKNQFQLGIGLFHFGTTTLEATVTGAANGANQLLSGKIGPGILRLAKSLTVIPNVAETVAIGNKVINQYKKGIVSDATEALIQSNAKVGLQKIYSYDAYDNFRKNLTSIVKDGELSKLPAAAKNLLLTIPQMTTHPLMAWWVPRLKVGAYLQSLKTELSIKPQEGQDLIKVKQKTWDDADDRLGQMVYDNIFWNKAVKDLGFMSVRSLGWSGGTIRAFYKGIKNIPESANRLVHGQGLDPRTTWLMMLPVTIGALGGAYHYAMTGSAPESSEDYFFPKDGTQNEDGTDHRVSLPSYMKDAMSYMKDWKATAAHKLSPFLQEGYEIYNNKDFYSVRIYNPDDLVYQKGLDILNYEAKSMIPFSIRPKPNETSDATQKTEQFMGLVSAPKAFERSSLENDIMAEAAKQYGDEVRTSQEFNRYVARRSIRDQIRAGSDYEDIDQDLKDQANIAPKALGTFLKEAKTDVYEYEFKKLPALSQIKLWSKMSDDDKERFVSSLHKMETIENLKTTKPELFEDNPEYEDVIDDMGEWLRKK